MEVIGVRYKKNDSVYYFLPKGKKFSYDDYVLVPSPQGKRIAKVVIENQKVDSTKFSKRVQSIIAKPTFYEIKKAKNIDKEANFILKKAKESIRRHHLKIKIVDAEIMFDRSRLILNFVSEERVDFRKLIRDLSVHFKSRIEMRQIGVRDEARLLGGISSCGRMLCCSTFLGGFTAVSIKMAKEQDLSLNSMQISGLCGRLMCCLKYEDETYKEARKEMPSWGVSVSTPDGEGIVKGVNYLTRTLRIQLQDKEPLKEYNINDIQVLK